MSSHIVDLKEVHAAYTRLTEKFKTFWTFHQFLQGVHKTFFGDAPGYQIDFQALYDQVKGVASVMTGKPPATVLEQIAHLDSRLDAVHRSLDAEDAKIGARYVRRFFERVRTEDERLLLALLRFYFHSRQASPETLDKMDFLLTLVGSRRSLDDGHYLARFPQELQKLFGSLLAIVRRTPPAPAETLSLVRALQHLKRDIDACTRFEDLTDKRILDNLRTIKHRMGTAYYDTEVLSAILEANLSAKNRFQALFRDQEKAITESSRQLIEIERELNRRPEAVGEELLEEFRRFKQFKDDFDRQRNEGEVKHQDVTKLADSIEQLMAKLELPSEAKGGERAVSARPAGAENSPPAPETEAARVVEVNPLLRRQRVPQGEATPLEGPTPAAPPPAAGPTSDPLTGDYAARILASIEMIDEGTGSGRLASGTIATHLRLEPWEVRAGRRIAAGELPADPEARSRDILFFEAAALRLRIDEEAQDLKKPAGERDSVVSSDALAGCGRCLVRAQEIDRRFRQAIEAATPNGPPEKLNELNRSRFRLLRGFSGLWLLHNARATRA